jgi:hypothetical protein
VAVSTKSLQVVRLVVPAITVNVVNVELTCVLWLKPAVLTKVLLVDSVWVLVLNDVALIDSLAPIPAL